MLRKAIRQKIADAVLYLVAQPFSKTPAKYRY